MGNRSIYLAGPEVFLPDARDVMREKRRLAREYGFEPTGPGSDEAEAPAGPVFASAIYARNDEAMRRSAFCLANVTPFRGISADAGTVYEIGFMIALGRRVWAYTNDPHDYGERVRASWYGGHVDIFEGGLVRGSDGLMIESHGKADNLMIDAGIERQGGRVLRNTRAAAAVSDPARDLSVFEKCLQEMALQIHE